LQIMGFHRKGGRSSIRVRMSWISYPWLFQV